MTLTELFTNIANAIRAKTGSSETIKAEDFPTEIADITIGHLDNAEYQEANDDLDDILEGSTPITIYPPDWSEIGYEDTPQDIIDGFNRAKEIYNNYDETQSSLYYKYYSDNNLVYMPVVDTKNVTNMQQTFYSCNALRIFPKLNTKNVTNMQGMFGNCKSLRYVPILDTENVTTMTSLFSGCSALTNESLYNILQMCINANSYTEMKTLNWIGITPTQVEICKTLSNYQAFLDAGWTTGY